MNRAEIRNAEATDRDSMVAIDHVAQCDPARVRFIERALRSETCVIAVQDGAVVAYGVLEHSFYELGFIALVYVAEAHRRRGIGCTLVQALSVRCRTPKLFTSTNESNQPMQHLLSSLGFRPSGIIHNLDPGDPELVFVLDQSAVSALAKGEDTDHGIPAS